MKIRLLFFSLFCSSSSFAGTPGNSDISIIYAAALLLLIGMLGVDYLIKYLKKRKQAEELENDEN